MNAVPQESVTGVAGPVMLAATAPELNRGDVLGGRYQIEAVIGNGGSGRVLRAFDRVSKAPVALKILRPEFAADPVWTERFSRELRVGRQIQHPNVCRVFDIGDADGNRFLSMELATGGTVRSQVEPGSMPRTAEDRIADGRAVIAGVAALHTAGIVHRDIKPENILRMSDGRLVVSDFGLATDPGAGPATTVMIGTPRYMAPEVVMGDPGTTRSDVWALGVVLHEILSGKRPDRTQMKHRRRVYTPPEGISPQLRRLVDLCARCSEEGPEDRPASAVDVVREFEAALRGQRFTRKFVQKQVTWGAVALAALGTLGLIRNRWTSRAVASSSQVAGSIADRALQPTGTPADWTKRSATLARLEGHVHCFSINRDRGSATIVWGEPRRAEEIDVKTGKRSPANLVQETFESGCPQVSSDGRSLLYEKSVEGAQHIFLAGDPEGRGGRDLVSGSVPLWLPNSQEFSFNLDSRHPAIFSIPTRQMSVVTNDIRGHYAIDDKALDSSGERLAVLYTTESFDSLLVVHSLPGLEVVSRMRVPQWARGLVFGPGREVLFTVMGIGGFRSVVSADLETATLRSVARIDSVDIRGLRAFQDGAVVLTRKLQFDLVRNDEPGSVPLTKDGQSGNGSLSPTGKLVIQRRLPDSREVIVLRDETGREQQITNGPTDLAPSFLPDGTSWLHTKLTSGEIIECSATTKRCVPIHSDALVPGFPTSDPSGEKVAYVTVLNPSRVRIVSRTGGGQRDFGPALSCPPVWTSGERLWAVTSADPNQTVWTEIDILTGKRTGERRSSRSVADQDQCIVPTDLRARTRGGDRVTAVLMETSSLARTHADPLSR